MLTVNLTDARARLSELADEVTATHEQVTITRNGVPAMVLLSADEYEGLIETMEIMRDPQAVSDLRQAQAEYERGEAYTLDDLNRVMAQRRAREDYDRKNAA